MTASRPTARDARPSFSADSAASALATRKALGVVIVAHDRSDLALRCAAAVGREVDRDSIVIVVNKPAAIHRPELEALQAGTEMVVLNPRPRGYGANLNAGARRLGDGYDYYLFLNDDAVPTQGSITALVSFLEANPRAGIVGPRVVGPDGRALWAAFGFPTVASEVAGALILPARLRLALRERFILPWEAASQSAVGWVLGAAFALRAAAFNAVGGFDESFFLYSEETDLAYRMRSRGWTSHVCPDALVTHLGGASTGEVSQRLLGLSRSRYIHKHWSRSRRTLLGSLLAAAYLWNTAYVALRVLVAPHTFRAKTQLWRAYWNARPTGGGSLSRNVRNKKDEES
jgi:GT2 family glycosyltransferase